MADAVARAGHHTGPGEDSDAGGEDIDVRGEAYTVTEAAAELGVSGSTLRRWVASGAPVARRGRRGRGCQTLVNPADIRAWRESSHDPDAAAQALHAALPELLGDAMFQAFRLAPDKRGAAWALAAAWRLALSSVADHVGIDDADHALPDSVARLVKIAHEMRHF